MNIVSSTRMVWIFIGNLCNFTMTTVIFGRFFAFFITTNTWKCCIRYSIPVIKISICCSRIVSICKFGHKPVTIDPRKSKYKNVSFFTITSTILWARHEWFWSVDCQKQTLCCTTSIVAFLIVYDLYIFCQQVIRLSILLESLIIDVLLVMLV